MGMNGNLAAEERQGRIRARLQAEGRVRIDKVAADLRVSEMTIRRDLLELEGLGVARRVRGGALAIGPDRFESRHGQQARAKAAIAEKLRSMVPTRGAVGLDASSTLVRLANVLEPGGDRVVITNGPETFAALADKPGITPLLTGGALDPRTGSLVGVLACRAAGSLLLERLFVSAAGVDPVLGTSEPCLEEADVKRAMVAMATEVVLAVDASKLDVRSVAVGIEWEQVTTLVTELDPGDHRLDPYRDVVTIR